MGTDDLTRRVAELEARFAALAAGGPTATTPAARKLVSRRKLLGVAGAGAVAAAVGAGAFRLAGAARAATTGTVVNYQGRLTDASGNPLTGTYAMSFALYTAATGGTPFWQEQRAGASSVPVTNGLFSVYLGSITPIDPTKLTQPAYLGITVGTDAEMTPRELLGTVPYAMQAETAANAQNAAQAAQAQNAATVNGIPADAAPTAGALLPLGPNATFGSAVLAPTVVSGQANAVSFNGLPTPTFQVVPGLSLVVSPVGPASIFWALELPSVYNTQVSTPGAVRWQVLRDGQSVVPFDHHHQSWTGVPAGTNVWQGTCAVGVDAVAAGSHTYTVAVWPDINIMAYVSLTLMVFSQ